MKMRKIFFMALTAMFAFASCNDNDEVATSNEKTSLLSIETEISAQQKSLRSGPLSLFPENSTLSLFVCSDNLGTGYPGGPYNNIKAEYTSGSWTMESPVRLTSENATIYALYPYMPSLGNGIGTVTIDHTTQTDYMFGTNAEGQQAINHNNPNVRLRMNHAQALLQFRINRLNYEDAGKVTRVEACNGITGTIDLLSKGNLDITTGDITFASDAASAVVEDANGLFVIPDTTPGNTDEYISLIILPVSNTSADGSIQFRFTIDSKVYSYNVPANTTWKQGTKYVYDVTLNGTELNIFDVIITDWVSGPENAIELF